MTPVSPLRIAEHRAVFNAVLPPAASAEDVYETAAAPLVRAFAAGECSAACVAAFGMAGAGKTWTMMGGPDDFRQRGITPRAVQEVFAYLAAHPDVAADVTVRVSYVELVADELVDLLAGTAEARADWRGRSPYAGGPAAGLASVAAPSPGAPAHASSLAYGGGVAGSWSAPIAASDAIALRLYYAGEAARRPRSPPAFGPEEGLATLFRSTGSSGGGSSGSGSSGSGVGIGGGGGAGHAGHGVFTLSMEKRVRLGGGRERVDFSKLLLVDLASPARTPVPTSRGVGSASPFTAPSFPHALLGSPGGAGSGGSGGSGSPRPGYHLGGTGPVGPGSPRTPGRGGAGGGGSSSGGGIISAGALTGLFAGGANITGGSSSKPRTSPPPVVGGVEASAAAERAAAETASINRSLGALERCACAIASARHAAATAFPSVAAASSAGASPGKSGASATAGVRRAGAGAGASSEASPPPVSFRTHKLTHLLQDCLSPSLQLGGSDIAASGVGGLRAVFIACLSLDPGQIPALLTALRLATQLGSMGIGAAPGAKAAAADADAGGDSLDLTAAASPLPSARSSGSPRRPATVPRLALSLGGGGGGGLGDSAMAGSPRSPYGTVATSGAGAHGSGSPTDADGSAGAGAGFAAMAAALSPADRALWRRYTAVDGPGGHDYEHLKAAQGRLRQAQAHAAATTSAASGSAAAPGSPGVAAPQSPLSPAAAAAAAQQAEAAAAEVAAAETELSALLRRFVSAFKVWAAASQAPLSPEERPAPWTPGSGRRGPGGAATAAGGAASARSGTAPSPGFRALGPAAMAASAGAGAAGATGWAWGSSTGSPGGIAAGASVVAGFGSSARSTGGGGGVGGGGAVTDYRGLDFTADPHAAALVDIGGALAVTTSPRGSPRQPGGSAAAGSASGRSPYGSPVEPLDDAEVFEAVTRARLTGGDDSPAALAFYEATRGHRERTLQRTGGAHALSPRGVAVTTGGGLTGSSTARSKSSTMGSPRHGGSGSFAATGRSTVAGHASFAAALESFDAHAAASSGGAGTMLMRTGRGGY